MLVILALLPVVSFAAFALMHIFPISCLSIRLSIIITFLITILITPILIISLLAISFFPLIRIPITTLLLLNDGTTNGPLDTRHNHRTSIDPKIIGYFDR